MKAKTNLKIVLTNGVQLATETQYTKEELEALFRKTPLVILKDIAPEPNTQATTIYLTQNQIAMFVISEVSQIVRQSGIVLDRGIQ